MNQTLSAPNGVGSLLNIGSVPGRDALSGVAPGTAAATVGPPSFSESLQQAQLTPGSGRQSGAVSGDSGQILPESGQLLPAGLEDNSGAADAAERTGVQVVVDIVTEAGAEAAERLEQRGRLQELEKQSEQRLKPLAGLSDSGVDTAQADSKPGVDMLNQIDRYRRADLVVAVDSALKQLGTFGVRGGIEKVTDGARERLLSDVALTHASAVVPESQSLPLYQVSQSQVSQSEAQSGVQAGTQSVTPVGTLTETMSPSNVVSESAAREVLTSQLTLNGAPPGGTESNEVVSGEVRSAEVRSLPGGVAEIARMSADVVKQAGEGGVSTGHLEAFSRTDSQRSGSAALGDERNVESIQSVPAGVAGAGGAQAVPSGMIGQYAAESEPMVQALVKNVDQSGNSVQPNRDDKGMAGPVEGGGRPQPQDPNSLQSGRQQNDPQSPAQSLSGIRDKLKAAGADVDRVSGSADSGGRSEGRQESQLTSFADSLAAASRSARPVQEPVQLVMPHGLRPGEAAWSQAVNDRVMIMASKNGQFADIQLDPPELGSLQVRLHVKNEQVTVVFNTPHGSVRDALEQNMPRLREMFADQGLNLSESSVEDHSGGNQREDSGSGSSFMGYQSDIVDDGQVEIVVGESLSLVDYYA
ncbi:flagellar hook-length control protein FliK [uncultured Amphritea sp.]|uniref:flagellar hook-length control protein FliK n=1 Tax=uncultured Amphritea sp. TaxID=981605 RepID=UPI0025D91363|nr:flagellar hook-length control protein FliK [uncultured Amphritea sp.]